MFVLLKQHGTAVLPGKREIVETASQSFFIYIKARQGLQITQREPDLFDFMEKEARESREAWLSSYFQ